MPRRYNLRNRVPERDSPPKNRDSEQEEVEEEEDESEDEIQSPQQQKRSSSGHRPESDDDIDSHPSDYNSSALSTTASDSFTFESGHSQAARHRGENVKKLYPCLPPQSDSPVSRRRDIHHRSSHSPPKNSSTGRLYGDRRHLEEWAETSQRKHRKRKAPESNQSTAWCGLPACLCVVAIVILLGVLVLNKLSGSTPRVEDKGNHFDTFSKKIDELKGNYPEQDERFWRTIKSCARHVFDSDEATYPAVLLMVGEKGNAAQAASLAQDVGQRFESTLSSRSSPDKAALLDLTVSPGKVGADKQKLLLDNWLKQVLNNTHTAIVLNHLEALSPEAALLLHGYCDGDNAPYKQAMLILGLYLDQPVANDKAAESALKKMWVSKLSEDKVAALLSRVANNIVLLRGPPK